MFQMTSPCSLKASKFFIEWVGVDEQAAVGFYELFRLHKHGTRPAAWVVNASLVWGEHLRKTNAPALRHRH